MLKKFALLLAVSIFGLTTSLVLIEIAFRLIELGAKPQAWNDRPPFYFQAENAPTLQDYPHAAQKPDNTFRIAVIGDSFSFAPYMQFTDAFPRKLATMLNLNNTALKAEVINYGVPAYSTTHEVAKVEQAAAEQADMVILQITLNDPEIKAGTPIGITNFTKFGPYQPGKRQAILFRYWHSLAYAVTRLHNTRTQREYIEYFEDLFENPRSYNPFSKAMGRIARHCSERNVKLVAVIFPLFGLPLDERYPFHAIHRKVDELLTSLNIPHIDLSQYYSGIPLERLQVMPGVDRHPNEIGHRIAAERIYTWLADNNFIPEELKIRLRFKNRTQIIKEEPWK